MDTIFMNPGSIKATDPRRLLLNLKNKGYICCSYQILAFTISEKVVKKSYKNNKFETTAPS